MVDYRIFYPCNTEMCNVSYLSFCDCASRDVPPCNILHPATAMGPQIIITISANATWSHLRLAETLITSWMSHAIWQVNRFIEEKKNHISASLQMA